MLSFCEVFSRSTSARDTYFTNQREKYFSTIKVTRFCSKFLDILRLRYPWEFELSVFCAMSVWVFFNVWPMFNPLSFSFFYNFMNCPYTQITSDHHIFVWTFVILLLIQATQNEVIYYNLRTTNTLFWKIIWTALVLKNKLFYEVVFKSLYNI